MKFSPYSFSRLHTHEQCSRRFKYKYVDKLPEGDSDKTALFKGACVHKILERYPEPYEKDFYGAQNIARNFIQTELGQKYLSPETLRTAVREIPVKLDSNISDFLNFQNSQNSQNSQKSCVNTTNLENFENFEKSEIQYRVADIQTKRKDLTFYGEIDYINNIDGALNLIDWKTGKYKDLQYQSFDQLMLYALYFFIRIPSLDKIRISYVYVEHNLENDLILERKYLSKYVNRLTDLIVSAETSSYEKNISRLCDWCPFQEVCKND